MLYIDFYKVPDRTPPPRESIRESAVPRRVRPGGAGLQAPAERGPGPGLVPEQASQVEEERAAPQDWTLLRSIM